jgi:replicative DNA helicase
VPVVLEQAPPSNLEAETTVIASILVDSEALSRVASFLQPGDFFEDRHQAMYRAALALDERRDVINQVTLAHELARAGRLEEAGGHAYLSEIIADLPTTVGVEFAAKIIQRDATYRRMITAAGDIARIGYNASPNIADSLGHAENLLLALRGGERLRDFVALRDLLESFLGPPDDEDMERLREPARTGFMELDALLTGLKRSDLIVLAARPSVGKSALALAMARNLAIGQSGKVALFSLEMSAQQVATRLVSAESEVSSQRLPYGKHTESEEGRISAAIGRLAPAEIYIDETPGLTVAELRAKARRLSHEVGLDLIVVDHMQLVHGGAGGGLDVNRVAEMSYISRSLKELARELEVPILALSQMSRAVEARQPHVPLLSDLRESGSIEQDADVVIFIYREDMYVRQEDWEDLHPEQPEAYQRGLAQIIIAKHRNGPIGTVNIRFRRDLAKFEDLLVYAADLPAPSSAVAVGATGQTALAEPALASTALTQPASSLPGGDADWNLSSYDDPRGSQ